MRSREILFGLLLSLSLTVSAQTDTLHIPSMKEVYRQNSWLAGGNPVGLSFNRFRSFSVAEASYSHHKGNFGNVSIPATSDIYSVYIIAKSKCATFSIEMYIKTPFKEYLKGVQNINTFYQSSELYNLQMVQKRTKEN